MEFQPRTEKEIAESVLLSRGEYSFEILNAMEKKSLAGNDMIELSVRVFRNGHNRLMTDYILPLRPAKFRNCCVACNVEEKYLNGSVRDEDFIGRRGKLKVGVERARKGYPPRNVIVDYLF